VREGGERSEGGWREGLSKCVKEAIEWTYRRGVILPVVSGGNCLWTA